MHRTRLFRHRLETGAIFAFADLANNRPFREPGKHTQHLTTFRRSRQPWFQENGPASSAALARLAGKFETCQRSRFGADVFRKRQHLKSTAQHFRVKQRLHFAFTFARISQKRLTPVAALKLGDDSRQKMMLIGKSGDAEPVRLRALDNALPVHRHRDIRVPDLFEWRIQMSMLGTDLNVSLKFLAQKTVVDRNHITTLQVRRDLVDGLERCLIEHRFTNLPLEEYKLVPVEAY